MSSKTKRRVTASEAYEYDVLDGLKKVYRDAGLGSDRTAMQAEELTAQVIDLLSVNIIEEHGYAEMYAMTTSEIVKEKFPTLPQSQNEYAMTPDPGVAAEIHRRVRQRVSRLLSLRDGPVQVELGKMGTDESPSDMALCTTTVQRGPHQVKAYYIARNDESLVKGLAEQFAERCATADNSLEEISTMVMGRRKGTAQAVIDLVGERITALETTRTTLIAAANEVGALEAANE